MKNKNFKYAVFAFFGLLVQGLLAYAGSLHQHLSLQLWDQAITELNVNASVTLSDLPALKTQFRNKIMARSPVTQVVADKPESISQTIAINIADLTVKETLQTLEILSQELQQRHCHSNEQNVLQAITDLIRVLQQDIEMIQAVEQRGEVASGEQQLVMQQWQDFVQQHYQAFIDKQSVLAVMDQSLTDEAWTTLANSLNQSATIDDKQRRMRKLIDEVRKKYEGKNTEAGSYISELEDICELDSDTAHKSPLIFQKLQQANRAFQYWLLQADRRLTQFAEDQTAQMSQAGPSTHQASVALPLGNVASEDQPFRGFRFLPIMPKPGEPGFGVGTLPQECLPQGIEALPGSDNPYSPHYGNFCCEGGGVYVWIPVFVFRVGQHTSMPLSAKYGAHAIEVQDLNKFLSNYSCEQSHEILQDLAEGNLMPGGWQLHRAFVNAGQVQAGFFIQKYLASMSEDGTSVISKQGRAPLSLTNYLGCRSSRYINDCQGRLDDAYPLAEKTSERTGIKHHVVSVFEYNALQMLILAQAQGARSNQYCAWWSENPNDCCPKGCCHDLRDNSALDLYWPSCWEDDEPKYRTKPLTGTCNKQDWASHNGQESGLMDYKGTLSEVAIGVTTANDGFNNRFFVLQRDADINGLTRENAFGSVGHLLSQGFEAIGSAYQGMIPLTGWIPLFSGNELGLPQNLNSQRHYCPLYDKGWLYINDVKRNLMPAFGGDFNSADRASVYTSCWNLHRACRCVNVGFRLSAYGLTWKELMFANTNVDLPDDR